MATPFQRILEQPEGVLSHLAAPGRDDDESAVVDALCGQVARFCAEKVGPLRRALDESIPKGLLGTAAELGLFGLTIPVEYGGAGLSMQAACRVVGEIARADGSLATTVGLHLGLGLRALVAFGSDALRSRWLPEAAAGRAIACFGATESEAGSDISAVRTRAEQRGDVLVVDGEKIFVTNGGIASVITALAFTPGLGGMQRGHSLVLLDLDTSGVRRGREESKLGLKGSSTISIQLDGVEVPVENVLGEAGRGLDHLAEALSWGRTFLSAGCLGTAWGAFEAAREHTALRKQFGRTLDGFEMVRSHLDAMRASAYGMESTIRLANRIVDAGLGDIGWESTVAKLHCSETAWTIVDTALQLHGGSGYVEETGLARRLRDVRVTRIFEGANDVLRLHLASGALAWRRAELSKLPALVPRVHGDLADAASSFDDLARRVVDSLLDARKRHGVRIYERQLLQGALADALVPLFVVLAAILRANDAVARALPSADDDLELCRELVRGALRTASAALARADELL